MEEKETVLTTEEVIAQLSNLTGARYIGINSGFMRVLGEREISANNQVQAPYIPE